MRGSSLRLKDKRLLESSLGWLVLAVVPFILSSCTDRAVSSQVQNRMVNAVKKSRSGVVAIHVESTAKARANSKQSIIGAGVIIDKTGLVVTTEGLIEDANSLVVMFQDGCESSAKVIGVDRETNLAVLETSHHEHGCYPVALELESSPEVGDLALILGYTPLTRGVAAGLGVLSESWMGRDDHWGAPLYLVQGGDLMTQVGSAVIGLDGTLLGICDNHVTGYEGVWTVIPVQTISRIATYLQRGEEIPRGWLGLMCHCSEEDSWQAASGLEVLTVVKGSPADKAGLASGDIILSINGRTPADEADARRYITSLRPGEWVTLELSTSDGQPKSVRLQLAAIGDKQYRTRRCSSRSM